MTPGDDTAGNEWCDRMHCHSLALRGCDVAMAEVRSGLRTQQHRPLRLFRVAVENQHISSVGVR